MNEVPKPVDIDGKPINVGSNVRYINTDTIGVIEDITTDDEGTWALLDTTQLYYRIDTLQITEKVSTKGKEHVLTKEEAKELIKAHSETGQEKVEDVFQATGGG
ncbi:DUF2098 domain-containing protein [Methanococcoides burtonii]|uniref:DUF2098 domain-containing protein n=1 Tax=Methanococcoides burtonii (strain DSM 6242 / NBRC 107633 / OCM 468 / ACE-M) TaxID=259564 RepID=Q12ZQ1_METBU|nr:DUF2098 domain-containing protein [Methanococcoides burtonii]ABE51075.1 Hypothetical protein Mbur_0053 [Methanococcoides burtonii DSM 6242]